MKVGFLKKTVRGLFQISISLFLTGLLIHCGEAQFASESENINTTSTEVNQGSVTALNASNHDVNVSFTNLSDDEDIVVALYSYDTSNATNSFEISPSLSSEKYLSNHFSVTEHFDGSGEEERDDTEEFHRFLRDDEASLDPEASLPNHASRYLRSLAPVGSQKEFKVMNSYSSTSSYSTVTATLRVTTDEFEFYVDNRNSSSLNDADLIELANGFMTSEMRDLFGEEADVDSNGKFAVLFTQAVNELGGMSGGIVTGFFLAKDELSRDVYSISNEMEIFYTVVPDEQGEFGNTLPKSFTMSNIYPSVLHHEFQHMISFNQHYFENDSAPEEAWLNEGLSHLAEDIFSLNGNDYMEERGDENPARVDYYLSNISTTCFSCSSSISARGGIYLFLRYIYEQAMLGNLSGMDHKSLISNLLNTNTRGTENLIQAIFGSSGTEADLGTLMGSFALAVYLSNSEASSDSQYNFSGINLRGAQDDNRGTVLNGPSIQTLTSLDFTDTLQGFSVGYIEISGKLINDNGGNVNFSFASGASIGGFVIQE